MNIPYIIETTDKGERVTDIYSRLLKDRIIFLGSPVTSEIANAIVAQLLFLNATTTDDPSDSVNDIHFYINSPGGSVSAGLAIYDIIKDVVQCDVRTYCIGQAASMGAFLLSAGTPGKRFALPSASIMIHQPLIGGGGIKGQATDIALHAESILKTKNYLNQKLSEHTGKSLKTIEADCERDKEFSAEEAVKYGLIDAVHSLKKDKKVKPKRKPRRSKSE